MNVGRVAAILMIRDLSLEISWLKGEKPTRGGLGKVKSKLLELGKRCP
jgi:hypothetical protein